ncbi:MAG: hypothetical protein PGN25_01205 [Methylorubrum populi]
MPRTARILATILTLVLVGAAHAAPARVLVYGPRGPLPAIKEAAETFGKARGIDVQVTAGPTPGWIDKAKLTADEVAAVAAYYASLPVPATQSGGPR